MKFNIYKKYGIGFMMVCNIIQQINTSDRKYPLIVLKNIRTTLIQSVEISQKGTFADIAAKYKEKNGFKDDVAVDFIKNGSMVDLLSTYDSDDFKKVAEYPIVVRRSFPITLPDEPTEYVRVRENTTIKALMEEVREHISKSQSKLANAQYYMVIVTKKGTFLQPEDIPSFKDPLSDYMITVGQTLLTKYTSRHGNSGPGIRYNLNYPPFWEIICTDNTKTSQKSILLTQVSLEIIKRDKTLEIIFNSPKNPIDPSVTISNASKFKIYRDFNTLFNAGYNGESNFNDPATQKLYEYGKEVLALWIHQNTKNLHNKFGISTGSCALYVRDSAGVNKSEVKIALTETWTEWLHNGLRIGKTQLYSTIAYLYPKKILTTVWLLPTYIKQTAVYRKLFTGQSQPKPQSAQ